ncbi:MAG: alpha-L-fucosidase [Planctomycetales bacterium]|nr:alpha-L-fucosidase [Planctomycetales bacterium]
MKAFILFFACVLVVPRLALAEGGDTTKVALESNAEHDARMKWWRDARFGMFIHWGVYAVAAGEWNGQNVQTAGEWIMNGADIPVDEYEPLAARFNPVKYDPAEWVRAAKDAGMRYIVITAKHHDGFCLFDTETTDWDVVDATPFGADVLKPLADECREQGLHFCTYYSIMDWHHTAQQHGPHTYNPTLIDPARKQEYVVYMKTQLRELLDSCDPEVLWFDGEWPDWWTEADGRDLYNYLRVLKPTIIVNNRVAKGREGMAGLTKDDAQHAGDFGTPEQEIPATGIPGVDWESCMTMNGTWGFHKYDVNWKSSETLIRNLVDIASKGGNYLLNVGPMANGEIPPESIARLAEIGRWMKVNGESIYGTSASPIAAVPWGRLTAKQQGEQETLFLHVFDWPNDEKLHVPGLTKKVTAARLLATEDALPLSLDGADVIVDLPTTPVDRVDTVIALEVARGLDTAAE